MTNVDAWRTFAGDAQFGGAGDRYRYRLDRVFAEPYGDRHITWIMLNPSTADAQTNDPTVARCVKRGHEYGAARVTVVNLYGLRSTDPAGLRLVDDPVGPGNAEAIVSACDEADLVIAAWGANADPDWASQVAFTLNRRGVDLFALGLTKDGVPRHPLYMPYGHGPRLWRAATGPCVDCAAYVDQGGHASDCRRRWPR